MAKPSVPALPNDTIQTPFCSIRGANRNRVSKVVPSFIIKAPFITSYFITEAAAHDRCLSRNAGAAAKAFNDTAQRLSEDIIPS
jgi:hypothetical protein